VRTSRPPARAQVFLGESSHGGLCADWGTTFGFNGFLHGAPLQQQCCNTVQHVATQYNFGD
jgi:hypothetical protein